MEPQVNKRIGSIRPKKTGGATGVARAHDGLVKTEGPSTGLRLNKEGLTRARDGLTRVSEEDIATTYPRPVFGVARSGEDTNVELVQRKRNEAMRGPVGDETNVELVQRRSQVPESRTPVIDSSPIDERPKFVPVTSIKKPSSPGGPGLFSKLRGLNLKGKTSGLLDKLRGVSLPSSVSLPSRKPAPYATKNVVASKLNTRPSDPSRLVTKPAPKIETMNRSYPEPIVRTPPPSIAPPVLERPEPRGGPASVAQPLPPATRSVPPPATMSVPSSDAPRGVSPRSIGAPTPSPPLLPSYSDVADNIKSRAKNALWDDNADPKKVEMYLKELDRFKSSIQASSESIVSNVIDQAKALPSLVENADERNKADVLSGFLVTLERVHGRYMGFHKTFLFDQNFVKKLRYLWRYVPEQAAAAVDAFLQSAVNPYFDRMLEAVAALPFEQTGGAGWGGAVGSTMPIVAQSYASFIESLAKDKEKIYDFYYNKATSSMFQWTPVHTLMYSLKALRILFIWISLFLASKTFQSRYVQKVFANNEDPPSLTYFVLLFWVMEAVLMMFIFIILYMLMFLLNTDDNFIINDGVLGKFVGDYVATTILIVAAGLIIGSVMMKKKYFRYKSDGMRAIRSFQEVMFYISAFIVSFPFFLLF